MTNVIHSTLATTDLHVPGYLTGSDPGAIGAGKYWVDTSGGTGAWLIKVRNVSNTGWEVAQLSFVINTLTGKSVLANSDVLLIEDSAAAYAKKKVLYGDLITLLDARYAGVATDSKVLASATDVTPGFLDAKVDNTSIKVTSQKLALDSLLYANMKSRIVTGLMEPSNTNYCAGCIMADGSVRLWGDYTYLGIGTNATMACQPTIPALYSAWSSSTYGTVTKIYSQLHNTYLVTSLGYVFSVGYQPDGQNGIGHTVHTYQYTLVRLLSGTFITNVIKMDTGYGGDSGTGTRLALTSDGKIYAWGYNGHGQCGQGHTTTPQVYAVQVPPPSGGGIWVDVCQANCPNNSSCFGLSSDGRVYAWGYNGYGQLGFGNTLDRWSPTPLGLTNIVKIGAAGVNSLQVAWALDVNGQMYGWGENTQGSVGDGTNVYRNTPQTLAAASDIADFWVGRSNYGSVAVRRKTGELATWGYNNWGQCGLGDASNNKWAAANVAGFIGLTASDKVIWSHPASQGSLYVLKGGLVYACGNGAVGQLGFGDVNSRYALTPLFGFGLDSSSYITDITTWGQAGHTALGMIDNRGNMYACGSNNLSMIGAGNYYNTSYKTTPTKLNF